jgi:hypothetical protein
MRSQLLLSLALLGACAPTFKPHEYDLGDASKLKILYAGALQTDRGKAFVAFLRESFATVDAIGLDKLDVKAAAPYDVVIADWKRRWGATGFDATNQSHPPDLVLERGFTNPIVLLAGLAGTIRQPTKIGSL